VSLFKSKSAPEPTGRPRDDYNGASTALTENELMQLAAKRHGVYVVVLDQKVIAQGPYLLALGHFYLNTHAGDRVSMQSHTDYVQQRLAAALLES
jgi:hypothetical protein